MAFCEFCKMDGQKTGSCAYCGTVSYTNLVTFVYGQGETDTGMGEIRLSDKYLIVRSVSKKEMAGNIGASSLGIIGALAAQAVKSAFKKSYAFYDLQEVQKVVYPYYTNKIKKDIACKFVNKDGTDFVLWFNQNGIQNKKMAKKFIELLIQARVYVENGAHATHSMYCERPFLTAETFGARVCQSAAAFVNLTEEQMVASPMAMNVPVQPMYQQPIQQPVYQQPMQQPVYQHPTYQQPVQQPVQNSLDEWKNKW